MSWCWHKWSKWEDKSTTDIYTHFKPYNTDNRVLTERALIQVRVCSRCGMTQYRRERIV